MISKEEKNIEIAKDTLNKINDGLYKELVDKSCEGTLYFETHKDFEYKNLFTDSDYELQVFEETSLEAIYRLNKEGKTKIGILNFASAKKPGGGFLNGRIAQEETLARSSSLYVSLLKFPSFYTDGEIKAPYYTDKMMYSPDVVFFKKDNGELLSEPVIASIITCAAPNLNGQHKVDFKVLQDTFVRRIYNILYLFEEQGCKNIILGAWGCGVFKNDPKLVSALFKRIIKQEFHNKFENIYFSIYDKTGEIIKCFKE